MILLTVLSSVFNEVDSIWLKIDRKNVIDKFYKKTQENHIFSVGLLCVHMENICWITCGNRIIPIKMATCDSI